MRGLKRKISLVLASCMVFSLAGCGDKEKSENKDYVNYVYARDDSFAKLGGDLPVYWYNIAGDNIYYCTYKEGEESTEGSGEATGGDASATDAPAGSSTAYEFYKTDMNGGSEEKIGEKVYTSPSEHISSITASPDGTIYFYDQNYETDSSTLYKYDGSQFVEVGDFATILQTDDSYLSEVYFQDDGSITAVYGNGIKKFDASMKQTSELHLEINVDSCCLDKDGNIILKTMKESVDENTAATIQFVVYDSAQNKLGATYDLDMSTYSAGQISKGFGDYDLIIRTSAALYGYKFSDGKKDKIVDYYASNITSDETHNNIMTDKDTLFFEYEIDSEPQKLYRYKKVDPKDIEDRTVLTLAITSDAYSIKGLVRKFNDSQTKYQVQIVDYSEEANPDSKMGADISAGKVPDIYVYDSGIAGQPIQKYVSKGIVEDLLPFIEKDPDMSVDDFVPAVLNSMKIDEKLYYITPRVSIDTLVGKASDIGEEAGWSAKDIKEYAADQKEGTMLMEIPSKDSLLTNLMIGCGNQFVDWEKGECHFDSEDFKNIMEICNKYAGDEEIYASDETTAQKVSANKLLLVNAMVSAEDMPVLDKMFGGKASFKGFPVTEGNGAYFSPSMGLAMSAKCDDKDGAWSFIKTLVTKEAVGEDYQYTSLVPIREDVFELKAKSLTTTTEYTDEFGSVITPREGEDSPYGVETKIEPLKDEDISRFRALVDNTSMTNFNNDAVSKIISEEAAAYFNGDKSLDDVCTIIQDRATTYINENK